MEYAVMFGLGLICGCLFVRAKDNKHILELEEENYNLRTWRLNNSNAEQRAATFARKLKKLEDIAIEDEQKDELHTITLAKIKKELLITR